MKAFGHISSFFFFISVIVFWISGCAMMESQPVDSVNGGATMPARSVEKVAADLRSVFEVPEIKVGREARVVVRVYRVSEGTPVAEAKVYLSAKLLKAKDAEVEPGSIFTRLPMLQDVVGSGKYGREIALQHPGNYLLKAQVEPPSDGSGTREPLNLEMTVSAQEDTGLYYVLGGIAMAIMMVAIML